MNVKSNSIKVNFVKIVCRCDPSNFSFRCLHFDISSRAVSCIEIFEKHLCKKRRIEIRNKAQETNYFMKL